MPAHDDAIVLSRPMPLEEVATPALVVDVAVMEGNLRRMAQHARRVGVALRPHTKTHKCPLLARRQIELGAVGVCCAKVSEAEVMLSGGVENVLITSPVATRDKMARIATLARSSPGVQVVVDHPGTLKDLSDASAAAGVVLQVLVDLDVGSARTGIAPGKPALELAESIRNAEALQLVGLQAYAGHVMHVEGHERRRLSSHKALDPALETRFRLERAGHEVEILSVGGTGTFDIDCDLAGVTDLQVGSYLFMDVEYRKIGQRDDGVFHEFEPSLFVLATAISQPMAGRMTFDAGFKALATDTVLPEFRDVTGVGCLWGGDEHLIVELHDPSREIRLGDRLELIVPHCDPTVNLYDYYHPYRNGQVQELWPISARGRSQ